MYGTKIICSKPQHLLLKMELGDSQQSSEKPLERNIARNVITSAIPLSASAVPQVPSSFVALLLPLPVSPPICTPLWLWCANTTGSCHHLEKGVTATADHRVA